MRDANSRVASTIAEACEDGVDNDCDASVDEECAAPDAPAPDTSCGCAAGGSPAAAGTLALMALLTLRHRRRGLSEAPARTPV